MDEDFKRAIILDNYQDPTNKGLTNDTSYLKANANSDSCIDNLDFEVKIEDNKIIDIHFDGEACAISTSATSIMIKSLLGKTIEEAKNIIANYKQMIAEEPYDEELLGELNVYDEICKQPNRKNCALIPTKALDNIFKQIEK